MSYMTKQQTAVLQCIASCPGGRATAIELAQRLRQDGQPVGLSTVYRQLEKLDCFLLQCEGCGAIFHMDCSHLGELYEHLLQGHGFAINPRRTMFYGLCEKCREAEK